MYICFINFKRLPVYTKNKYYSCKTPCDGDFETDSKDKFDNVGLITVNFSMYLKTVLK